MSTKVLSIIIPTYNMEKYLRRCLDSLIVSEKLLSLLDVWVVNDGSKDSSSAIAHEYATLYPDTFHVVDKENGNYGSCINRGLKEIRGQYVKVLDSDDWYQTIELEKLISYCANHTVDLIITDFVEVYYPDGKRILRHYDFQNPDGEIARLDTTADLTSLRGVMMHAITYKADIFKQFEYNQTEGISYTDTQWNILPATQIETYTHLPFVVYAYGIGREGQTMSPDIWKKSLPQRFKLCLDMAGFYESHYTSLRAENKRLIDIQFFGILKSIYSRALFDRLCTAEQLAAFDKQLAEFPLVYQKSETLIYINYLNLRFIKAYRQGERHVLFLANLIYRVRHLLGK